MIKIRVGNKIYISKDGKFYKTTATEETIIEIGLGLEWKGVPITEKWLEKFNFKADYKKFHLNDIELHHTGFGNWMVSYNGVFIRYVKFVHELQNEYHRLLNKEF